MTLRWPWRLARNLSTVAVEGGEEGSQSHRRTLVYNDPDAARINRQGKTRLICRWWPVRWAIGFDFEKTLLG